MEQKQNVRMFHISIKPLIGATGYIFQLYLVLVICMNPGLGVTTLGMMLCLVSRN